MSMSPLHTLRTQETRLLQSYCSMGCNNLGQEADIYIPGIHVLSSTMEGDLKIKKFKGMPIIS